MNESAIDFRLHRYGEEEKRQIFGVGVVTS